MTTSAIDQAFALARSGRGVDGLASLLSAGEQGDAGAAMQAAVWQLTGEFTARDLRGARGALRQAAAIGHVDAALMEVALTANGAGAPANWADAVALLRTAAKRDPVAARQLALVEAMRLDVSGSPCETLSGEGISQSPRLVRFPGFLSAAECQHLANVGQGVLAPATVFDPRSGRQIAHPVRTSDGGPIGPPHEDLVIRAINHRIAAVSGTTIDQGESLTVLRYSPGQEYRLHHDAVAGLRNQRSLTVLLYLNASFVGGETEFPALGVTIMPTAGEALLFSNLEDNGAPDQRTRHAGLPVRQGVKWLATRWIRREPFDVWTGDQPTPAHNAPPTP